MNKDTNQIIALSANFQATYLVDQLATKGDCEQKAQHMLIESLFQTQTNNADIIYPNKKNLQQGLLLLKQSLVKKTLTNPLSYSIQLNLLAKKIARKKAFITAIADGINRFKDESFFDHYHSNSQAKLAELYRQTAGKLSPTIMVKGNAHLLSDPAIANQIRTLLLSGIRAAMLWQAHGGKPLQLLWHKKKILETIKQLNDNC